MSAPPPPRSSSANDDPSTPNRPEPFLQQPQAHETSSSIQAAGLRTGRRKRNHRAGKKKRTRKQSFAAPSEEDGSGLPGTSQDRNNEHNAARASFYRLQEGNLSNTSMESEALLDHRYICCVNEPFEANYSVGSNNL
jgi:magnesium transporter